MFGRLLCRLGFHHGPTDYGTGPYYTTPLHTCTRCDYTQPAFYLDKEPRK